jgi:hypothetical protein
MSFTKIGLKSLVDHFNKHEIRPYGNLLTLSRYSIGFDASYFNRVCSAAGWETKINIESDSEDEPLLNDKIVFSALGFKHLESMDYSNYEWADIIYDLNDTNIPKKLENKYDFIVDGGTIEHIFNLPNVLENIYHLLKVGGTFFFDQPIFQGFNKGYFNTSPCLFYEYFLANKYEINSFFAYACKDGFYYIADPVINDIIYDDIPLIEGSVNAVCGSVTKTTKTSYDIIPYQGAYKKLWERDPNIDIDSIFSEADQKSIYLYGTGVFAKNMVSALPDKYKVKIAGFLSREWNEIGKSLYGYKIMSLDDIADTCRIIIIATSAQYQETIYRRIKQVGDSGIKVVRLYK